MDLAKDLKWQPKEYHIKKMKFNYWLSIIYFCIGGILLPVFSGFSWDSLGTLQLRIYSFIIFGFASMFFISVAIFAAITYIEHKLILEIRQPVSLVAKGGKK